MSIQEEIYTFLLSKAPLNDAHKQELVVKRGLSDATIKKEMFGSTGKHLSEIEPEFLSKFKEDDLIASGVFIHNGKSAGINPLILSETILIPYLREGEIAYHLRFCMPGHLRKPNLPKILGFPGIQIEIYQEKNLLSKPAEIILTEGEFKAAAGCQFGIPSIGIPGISSFSEMHFPRLVALLNKYDVRRINIVFDNEEKDNPNYPDRYKENPADRFDTQFYAYYMAVKLEKEGKDVRIATLPDGWRENGKIDIDGVAAQGRTAGEIKKILYDAKHYREYLSELPSETRHVILRKNSQKRHRSHIRKEFGHYVATRRRGKTEWDEIISNFVMKIVATHETPEGMVREVLFINEYGETSKSFSLDAPDMARSDSFAAFSMGRGNFVWRGQKEDLFTIWESEFLMDDGRHIIEPDHIGWIESEKIWLFGNVGILPDGREIRPDKNHVFWIPDKKMGLKPIPLGITSGKSVISEGIPYLSFSSVPIKDIKDRFAETIGTNEANLAIGWITAVCFLEEVFDLYGCFPFLFITGRRGSGKSTVAEWLINFFGLENAGKMASDTTQVGIQRYLSYYSSLPVFLDEYRNTKNITMKTGFLRNAYNRQSAGKGIKADFGLREAKVRGTILISGEETPEDNALLTRCIVIIVSERNRTKNHYAWFMQNRMKFSNHILDVLRRKKTLLPLFLKVLNEAKDYFVKNGADDRTAINYAIVAAGYAAAFGEDDLAFAKWITSEAQRVKEEYQDEQAVAIFFEDLIAMRTRGLVDNSYWDSEPGKIYLYFHGLYSLWSQEFRKTRGVEPFKAASIRDYLKEEPGFLAINEVRRIKGSLKKCVVFDAEKAPDIVKHLIEEMAAGPASGW